MVKMNATDIEKTVVTDNELLWITKQIHKYPAITVAMLDKVIDEYQSDIVQEDARYAKNLVRLDFQKKMVDSRMSLSPRSRDNAMDIRNMTRDLTEEHHIKLLRIDEDLKMMYKIKKVLIEMNTSASVSASPCSSPRDRPYDSLGTSGKSKSFLKRSVEFLMK